MGKALQMHHLLMSSYKKSGIDSARILLLTATPIVESPMELIQLINLCKAPESQMPVDYREFQKAYLDPSGKFTPFGEAKYLDDIAGYVSYLNRFDRGAEDHIAVSREKPVFTRINVPIIERLDDIDKFDSVYVRQYVNSGIADLKRSIAEQTAQIDAKLNYFESPSSYDSFIQDQLVDLQNSEEEEKQVASLIVRKTVSDLIGDVKKYSAMMREKIASIKQATNNKFLFQTRELQKLKELSQWDEEEFRRFQSTPYYNIKYKCGRSVPVKSLHAAAAAFFPGGGAEEDEQLMILKSDIAKTNEAINEHVVEFKQRTLAYNATIQKIRSALQKKTLSWVEKDQLISQINEQKKLMRFLLREEREKRTRLENTRKNFEHLRRKTYRRTVSHGRAQEQSVQGEVGAAKEKLAQLHSELLSNSHFVDEKFKELLNARAMDGDEMREVVFGILGMQAGTPNQTL